MFEKFGKVPEEPHEIPAKEAAGHHRQAGQTY
jgi:hypothetical protein